MRSSSWGGATNRLAWRARSHCTSYVARLVLARRGIGTIDDPHLLAIIGDNEVKCVDEFVGIKAAFGDHGSISET